MTPDPKPQKRRKADTDEWKVLRKLKLGPCRCCGALDRITLHHLVGRDLGGSDVPSNLVPLCGSGTTGCHGEVENRDRLACGYLRARLTPREKAYVIRTKGPRYLAKYYPRLIGEDLQTTIKETDQSGA